MSASENLTRVHHHFFIAVIALLELWLAMSNKANDLYCGRPRVLNESSVLDLDEKPLQMSTGIGIDIIDIYVMNSPIASIFRRVSM